MKKLNDEELSRVLGLSDTGELNFYGTCIAVAALALERMPYTWSGEGDPDGAWGLSQASASGEDDFGGTPDAVLRFLEAKGLA